MPAIPACSAANWADCWHCRRVRRRPGRLAIGQERHLDLRCADRRAALHRLRHQPRAPHPRQPDRATREAPQPQGRRPGQGELFPTYRYHAVFTDSPFQLVQAESQHRGHAIIEQVIADSSTGPWPTYPPPRSTPTPPGNSPSPRTR